MNNLLFLVSLSNVSLMSVLDSLVTKRSKRLRSKSAMTSLKKRKKILRVKLKSPREKRSLPKRRRLLLLNQPITVATTTIRKRRKKPQ